MTRHGLWALLALLCIAGCNDWSRVSPPPVRLTLLESSFAAAGQEGATTTPSGPSVRLIRALSPGSLATIHVPDMGLSARRFKETSLYRLLNSKEMQELLGKSALTLQGLSLSGTPNGKGPGGMDFGRIQRALTGELIVGLEDLELRADQPAPNIKLLFGMTVNGAERDIEQLIEFFKLAASRDPNTLIEQGSVEGTGFTRFRSRNGPIPLDIEVAIFQNALLVGIGSEVVIDAIGRLRDDAAESLSDDDSFGRCMQRVSHANDVVRVHVDIAGIVSRFGGRIPQDVRSVLDVLGIEQMKALAGALRIEGKNLVATSFLDSPGGKDLITGLLRQHPVDRGLLEQIPASATSFSMFALDGAALLEQLRSRLSAGAKAELEETLDRLSDEGIHLESDLLPVFGPHAALVTVPTGRRGAKGIDAIWNQLLGTAFLVEIRDREKALTQLARLPQSNDQLLRFEERIGATHVIGYRFPALRLPSEFGIFLAPSGDYLVVAASREGMRQMLQRPSGEASEHFRKEIRSVPEEAIALCYDDMSQGTGMLFQAILGGIEQAHRAQQAVGETVAVPELDWSKLPVNDFGPAISFTVADERGILNQSTSATAGLTEAGGLTGALVAASIALPNLAQARIQANEEAAIQSLRAIRTAQLEYRNGLVRDTDSDGEGEHAFLSELLGDEHAREGGRPIRKLLEGFERTPLGYGKNGYYFRVYLPAEDGSPIGDHESAKRLRQADGDLAESIAIVVAWPRGEGVTGRRSLLLDGRGVIRFCDGGYGGDDSPPPDLFSSQPGNLAAAPIKRRERPRDGRLWSELR